MWGKAFESEASCVESNWEPKWLTIGPLRISVTPLTARQVTTIIGTSTGKRLLLNHNLHSAYLHDTNEEFQELYRRADWVLIDGSPILWLAGLCARVRLPACYRISSTDWIEALPQVELGKRLFVFGATPESNAKAVETLRRRLQHWRISGADGYIDDELAVKLINAFKPDLVIIGLGMPRQEHFLSQYLTLLPPATYATVGGAIDYVAGTTKLAPRWLGRYGLEWLWRLANEPRRLAYRYLVEPMLLLYRVRVRPFG